MSTAFLKIVKQIVPSGEQLWQGSGRPIALTTATLIENKSQGIIIGKSCRF
jgi:hypothetical protein